MNTKLKNLHINDNDLIGNKFNGHNLHIYLRDIGIDSTQLVWNKESKDDFTYIISGGNRERESQHQLIMDIQQGHSLNSLCNPLIYDILYNRLFLETDVVHLHLIHNYIFDIHMLPILSRLKPVVWTLHDPWALGGHCVHHFDCEKWETHCADCPYLSSHFPLMKDNSALNFEIKKQAIQNSQAEFIVASKWMYEQTKRSPVLRNKRVHLIPFGIDQKIFQPQDKLKVRTRLGIPHDASVIMYRCDYSEFKGMDFVDYVSEKLKSRKKIYCLVTADYVRKKTRNCTYVEYGWVKDDQLLADIYSASDLFIMPSKMDTFGMMAVEAMSCGVLPVVLEGTALPETINAPNCGVAIERDKDKYLAAIQYYLDHGVERNLRAQKCLSYAKANYSKDVYVNKVVSVYEQAMLSHKHTETDNLLLTQLKKNMIVEPVNQLPDLEPPPLSPWKRYVITTFYRIDKVVPKKMRGVIKKIIVSSPLKRLLKQIRR